MEWAASHDQKEEREKKKSNTITADAGKFKRIYDKTSNVKSKYNEIKSGHDNITSAANKAQNEDRWLKNGKVHPTSQIATQQLLMQTAANMLPQNATILGMSIATVKIVVIVVTVTIVTLVPISVGVIYRLSKCTVSDAQTTSTTTSSSKDRETISTPHSVSNANTTEFATIEQSKIATTILQTIVATTQESMTYAQTTAFQVSTADFIANANTTESATVEQSTIATTILQAIVTTTKEPMNYPQTTAFQGFSHSSVSSKLNRNGTTVIHGLNRPLGLAIDPQDNTVFVADYGNHRIVASKPDDKNGRLVMGGLGTGLNQLNHPTDMVFDKENRSLLICDQGNRRVIRWSLRNGTTQGETIISNTLCHGLAMGNDSALYVTDEEKHEVKRYSKNNSTGIIVAGGNGVGNGPHQLNVPYYVAVDGEGAVYVSDSNNHRVAKWMSGSNKSIIVAGGRGNGADRKQLSSPQGVVVDTNGTIYVSEQGNHRVTRWDIGMNESDLIVGEKGPGNEGRQLNAPEGLLFDAHGYLYVTDSGNGRVQCFSIE